MICICCMWWLTSSRSRSAPPAPQASGQRRPGQPPPPVGGSRTPIHGATLTVSLGESDEVEDEEATLRREVADCEGATSERVLRLCLRVKWEIGEGGVGGGWRTGEVMDTSSLRLVSARASPVRARLTQVGLPIARYRRYPFTCDSSTCRSPDPSSGDTSHVTGYATHLSYSARRDRGSTSCLAHLNTFQAASDRPHCMGVKSLWLVGDRR